MTEREQFDAIAVVLSNAIAATKELLHRRLRIAPRTKRHKIFALIALNHLMRQCESVAAMVSARAFAGINVTVRAAFETYADLLNLLKHEDSYPDYMSWASFKQQETLLRGFVDPSSPYAEAFDRDSRAYMRGVSSRSLLEETCRELEETAKRLPSLYRTKKGEIHDRDKFKFELAGKVHEYNALYRHLSGGAHGRISAMGDGIFESKEGIDWPPREPIGRPLVALDSVCAILVECSALLARRFDKPTAQFRGLAAQLEAFRGGGARIIQ
jgi:hypothetical protein